MLKNRANTITPIIISTAELLAMRSIKKRVKVEVFSLVSCHKHLARLSFTPWSLGSFHAISFSTPFGACKPGQPMAPMTFASHITFLLRSQVPIYTPGWREAIKITLVTGLSFKGIIYMSKLYAFITNNNSLEHK